MLESVKRVRRRRSVTAHATAPSASAAASSDDSSDEWPACGGAGEVTLTLAGVVKLVSVDDAQIEVVVVGGGDVADAAVGEGIGSIAPIENSMARTGANVVGLKSETSTSQTVASSARSQIAAAFATRASRARHCRRVLFV